MPVERETVVRDPLGSLVVVQQVRHRFGQEVKVPTWDDDDILFGTVGVRVEEVVEVLQVLHLVSLFLQG